MSKKLLLADDSVVIQKLVGLSFANENIEIFATDNGDDALIRAREIVPDVVLADVVMPGKNGYEVCEAIRQDPALAQIPVLLLTGTFEAFDEDRANSAGANGQITKPFEAQALVARVTEVIEAAEQQAGETPAPDDLEASEAEFFETTAPPSASEAFSEGLDSGLSAESDAPLDATDPLTDAGELIESDPSSVEGAVESDFAPPSSPLASPLAPPLSSPLSSPLTSPLTPSSTSPAAAHLTPPALPPQSEPQAFEAPPLLPEAPPALPEAPLALPEAPPALPEAPPLLPEAPPALPMTPPAPATTPEASDGRPAFGSGYASASEVDSALSAASDDAATILVGDNDANAKTSPRLTRMDDGVSGDDFTMYTPRADIDRDSMTVITPNAPYASSAPGGPDVADLDERLAGTGMDVSETAVADEADTRAQSHDALFSSNEADASDDDLLEIGPSSLEGDDLDFSFDVSEQQPVDLVGDPFGRAYSSLEDISESQILSDPSAELETDAEPSDYDVSSSDLAVEDFSEVVLPPNRASEAASSPARSDSDADLISVDESEAPAVGRFGEAARAATPAFEIPDDGPADDADPAGMSRGFAAIESDGWGEDSGRYDSADEPSTREASIPDLSPMMEQRIQETLEKVAWEAFSDLSESIVKQVMERVEKIAWEVVPQMAETLVREEIRQMKGEDD